MILSRRGVLVLVVQLVSLLHSFLPSEASESRLRTSKTNNNDSDSTTIAFTSEYERRQLQAYDSSNIMLRFFHDVAGFPLTSDSTTSAVPRAGNYQIAFGTSGVSDSGPFTRAASKWSTVITGDQPDFSGTLGGSSSCGSWPTYIDDLYICGTYKSIDGAGGILGYGGPQHLRTSNQLPLTGTMTFDSADAGSSALEGIILHEMGHVLGIGTLWERKGLASSSPPCTYKVDSAASNEYRAISGCGAGESAPTEQTGGSGTACGHWSESILQSELMTGFQGPGTVMPLSTITTAGLQDLGYTVDLTQSDGYTACDLGQKCSCGCCAPLALAVIANQYFGDGLGRRRPLADVNRPQLSQVGRDTAIAFGKQQLAAQQELKVEWEQQQLTTMNSDDNGAEFIGDEAIFVVYEENGATFSIMVKP